MVSVSGLIRLVSLTHEQRKAHAYWNTIPRGAVHLELFHAGG